MLSPNLDSTLHYGLVSPAVNRRERLLSMTTQDIQHHPAAMPGEQFVPVSISTTAGFYPAHGFNHVPVHQKVSVELEKAKHELKIRDTAGWVATVTSPAGKRVIDPTKNYIENTLVGEVEIDWGPTEGGGGR
jgi:hypothetical protein